VEFVLDSEFMEHLRETTCPNEREPGSRTRLYAVLRDLVSTFDVSDIASRAMFRCVYEVPDVNGERFPS